MGRESRENLSERPGAMLMVFVATGLVLVAALGMALKPCLAGQYGAKNEGSIERGQKRFEQSCAFCHGADATGARGPDLVRSRLVADDVNGNLIGEVVRNGRPEKGMPALPLTQEQIADVATFLHARAKEALMSARLPKVYSAAKLLTGNAQAGEEFFNGAGGCKSCHSVTGDLAHVATKYSPLDLEARMLYPRGEAQRTVTVKLASGERIEGRLAHIDEFSVALRGAQGEYHSYSLDHAKTEVHDPLAAHQALLGKLTQADVHNLFAFMETLK